MKLRWRFGVIAGVALALFCLYPQFKMSYLRGGEWNGHYAFNDIDEAAYASYVRALIDGRTRKNDPYTGRDDTPESPQAESLFSIQFAAPYTIAIPARMFGVTVPWAMIVSGALAGFLAAIGAYWFIFGFSRDPWFSMAAALATFAFGALAAGEGAFSEIFLDGFSYPYFPGFRRYIPALAMPAFFGLLASLWRFLAACNDALDDADRKRAVRARIGYGALSTLFFAYCVYSYFYIWTTAAAYLGCLALVWLVERPKNYKRQIVGVIALGAAWVAVLVPYAVLLSRRAASMDKVQLLVRTHMPDLARIPEWVALASLFIILIALVKKIATVGEVHTLFAIALALLPFVIFNQQVITGRSLQPIHYQVFIGNYAAAMSVFVSIALLWRRSLGQGRTWPKLICAAIFLAACFWGTVECHYTVRVLDDANVERDRSLPTAKALDEFAAASPMPRAVTVLSYDWLFADDLPSVATLNVLWSRHQHVFAGLTWDESKNRYYKQLYYQGVDEKRLDWLLRNDFVTMIALFGWGRHSTRLTVEAKPLTGAEIRAEVQHYKTFIENFGRNDAADPLISYVVVPASEDTDLSRLEAWYNLEPVRQTEMHIIYKARLK